jgi:hypothetical protein
MSDLSCLAWLGWPRCFASRQEISFISEFRPVVSSGWGAHIDLVLADRLLVALQTEPPQPRLDVDRVVPALSRAHSTREKDRAGSP